MEIIRRTDAHFAAIGRMAARVQANDRYPIYLPDGDLDRFILQPPARAAWVAVDEGAAVGHVALNDQNSDAVMSLVGERIPDGPSPIYVTRLLTDPRVRGRGIGRALLEHARTAGMVMGRTVALDVVDIPSAASAIALYRAAGWDEVGRVTLELGGESFDEIVFVAPAD